MTTAGASAWERPTVPRPPGRFDAGYRDEQARAPPSRLRRRRHLRFRIALFTITAYGIHPRPSARVPVRGRVGGRVRPRRPVDSDGTASIRRGVARYTEDRQRPDAAAFDWDQTRLQASVTLLLQSNADVAPLPRALADIPRAGAGEAARAGPPRSRRAGGRRCRLGREPRAAGSLRPLAASRTLSELPRLPCRRRGSQPIALAPAGRLPGLPRRRGREDSGVDAADRASGEQPSVHPPAPRRRDRPRPRRRFHPPVRGLPHRAGRRSHAVQPAVAEHCLDCHGIKTAHLERPGHGLRHLPRAAGAGGAAHARTGRAHFRRRDSHREPDFAWTGHGKLATRRRAPSRPPVPPATPATTAPSAT